MHQGVFQLYVGVSVSTYPLVCAAISPTVVPVTGGVRRRREWELLLPPSSPLAGEDETHSLFCSNSVSVGSP